jgi:DNA-binding transcriptional LysR family regulator
MIELRHLRYAVTVADERHMTRAAQRLGIQQPPLSQQIRALETMIGAALFRRLPRGVELTEAGRAFVEKARVILRDVDLAVEAARRSARGEEGNLAIGYTSSAAFHPFVSMAIRALRLSLPGVTFRIGEGSSGDLIADLLANRLDAAFLRAPREGVAGLVTDLVDNEEMVIALPDDHPLAALEPGRKRPGLKRRLPLAALADQTFILYRRPSGPGLYDNIIAACHAAGFSPRVGQEAPKLVSTLSLVAAGLGISIIPQSMARLETNGITYLRFDTSTKLTAPLLLGYRDEAPSGALKVFVEQVKERARGF